MRLNHRFLQPQQRCAAGLVGIRFLFQRPEFSCQEQAAQHAGETAHHAFQLIGEKLAHALGGFQDDIAGKAIGHRHIYLPQGQAPGLHIPGEINRGIFQQFIGFNL